MMKQQHRSVSAFVKIDKPFQESQQSQYKQNPSEKRKLNVLALEQSQSDEQNILWEIDSLLVQNQAQSMSIDVQNINGQQGNCRGSQRQMLLSFKICELQKIIKNLNMANRKLNAQLQKYYLDDQHQEEAKQNQINGNIEIYDNTQFNSNNNENNIYNIHNSQYWRSNNQNSISNQSNSNDHNQINSNNNNQSSNNNNKQNSNNNNKQNSNNNKQSKSINSKQSSNNKMETGFCDELTQMHGQFQQIEQLIGQYKEQLNSAQKKWNALKEEKDQQIDSLKTQLMKVTEEKELIEHQIHTLLTDNQLIKHQNQQLLIDIHHLELQLQRTQHQFSQIQQPPLNQLYTFSSPRYERKQDQFQDYHFNQKIKRQMENMINELFKKLQNEQKLNSSIKKQIKRLNTEVIDLQRTIQLKNDTIYQLEMRTIQIEKNYNIQRGAYSNINTTRSNISKSKKTPRTIHKQLANNQQQQFDFQLNLNPKNQQLWLQNQYQYTDRTDRTSNYYDNEENPVISLPIQNNPNLQKLKPYQVYSNIRSNSNKLHSPDYNSNEPLHTKLNLIKPKRIIQLSSTKPGNNNKDADNLQPSDGNSAKDFLNKEFLCFSIMQLESGKINITMKQKILIISRVIEMYCKKIKTQSYQNLIAEDIQVYNFNHKFPNLLRVRATSSTKTETMTANQDCGEEKLMYNLAFIVQSIVKEVRTIDRQDLEVDLNLTDVIEEILNKNMNQKIAYFQQLSKSLQSSTLTLG